MIRKLISFSIVLVLTVAIGWAQENQSQSVVNYISKYKHLAMLEQELSGVPAAITLAQGIYETGAGTSVLCTDAHNHFGIKCGNHWTGATFQHYDDGRMACFRKYKNAVQSFRDHADFLKDNPRYRHLFKINPRKYKKWAHGLQTSGYATNKRYAKKLIAYIQQYHLEKYTVRALKGLPTDERDSLVAVMAAQPAIQPQDTTVAATADESTETSEAGNVNHVSYFVTTQKNGLKGFYAPKGALLLEYAIHHRIRYSRLLRLNDLPDAPLEADMFIYLERKREKGRQPFFKVQEGMDLLQVSQATGVDLSQLQYYNHLQAGEEPAPNSLLSLQKLAAHKPKLVSVQNRQSPEVKKTVRVAAPASSNAANYVYTRHEPEPIAVQDNPPEVKTITKPDTTAKKRIVRKVVYKPIVLPVQKSDTLTKQKPSAAEQQKFETIRNNQKRLNKRLMEERAKNSEKKPHQEEPLSHTERIRRMMDKIVYKNGKTPENNPEAIQIKTAEKQTGLKNDEDTTIQSDKIESEEKPSPTEKLRAYMKTVQTKREAAKKAAATTTLPPGQIQHLPAATQVHTSPKSKYYTVKRGDTAFGIAQKFGITLDQLRKWNHLSRSMTIKRGSRLRIAP